MISMPWPKHLIRGMTDVKLAEMSFGTRKAWNHPMMTPPEKVIILLDFPTGRL